MPKERFIGWTVRIKFVPTFEKVQELCSEKEKLDDAVAELRKTSLKSLWAKDLDALEKELDELDRKDADAAQARKTMREKSMANNTGTSRKRVRKDADAAQFLYWTSS